MIEATIEMPPIRRGNSTQGLPAPKTVIVAYVVGYNRCVSRIVLGNSGFNFPHQVGADVSSLGVYATANTSKNAHERAAEAKADKGVEDFFDRGDRFGCNVVAGKADQPEPYHHDPRNRPTFEGDRKGRLQTAFCGFSRSHVGFDGHHHADVTRNGGTARTDDKPD
jgi:hypothetical protein